MEEKSEKRKRKKKEEELLEKFSEEGKVETEDD